MAYPVLLLNRHKPSVSLSRYVERAFTWFHASIIANHHWEQLPEPPNKEACATYYGDGVERLKEETVTVSIFHTLCLFTNSEHPFVSVPTSNPRDQQ